jgi:hypothetical protein
MPDLPLAELNRGNTNANEEPAIRGGLFLC